MPKGQKHPGAPLDHPPGASSHDAKCLKGMGAASHDSLLPLSRGPPGWVLHRARRRHPEAREQTAEASHRCECVCVCV